VLSGRGLCDELITRPEKSYRIWCVVVCDLESWKMRRLWPALCRSSIGQGERECACFLLLWIIFGVSVPGMCYMISVMRSFLTYNVFRVGQNYLTLLTCVVYRKTNKFFKLNALLSKYSWRTL